MHIGLSRLSTLLHISSLAVVAACTGAASDQARDSASNPSFKVALLTPGPVSDRSWNGGAYEGLLRIRDSLGAHVSHIQTRTPAEFEENFRQYGMQGYQLVFGHGFEFQDAAVRVSPEFPRTVFVTTSGNTVRSNVAGMVFGFEDASYEAGVLAGLMTRSDVLGMIGGTELPPLKSSFRAFAAGARSVNPNVRVLTSYIGNWDDASAGKEQALAQIGRRADLIFQNADAAGLGIFQAARERSGVYVFGSNSNQNDVAPEVVIGSVVIDLPKALLAVAREVRDGQFTARVIRLGAPSDVVRLVLNPALEQRIPAAARQTVDSVRAALIRGDRPRVLNDSAFASP
jgi:basic membrane lipoprotein Med (substrate-binding protein (PBP1-ABC) superfamily)